MGARRPGWQGVSVGHPPPLRPSGSVSAPLRQVSVAVGLTGTPLTARQPHEALHSLPGPPHQAAHSRPLGTASGPHPVGEGLQSGRLQKCCFPPAEFSSLGHAVSPVHPFFCPQKPRFRKASCQCPCRVTGAAAPPGGSAPSRCVCSCPPGTRTAPPPGASLQTATWGAQEHTWAFPVPSSASWVPQC